MVFLSVRSPGSLPPRPGRPGPAATSRWGRVGLLAMLGLLGAASAQPGHAQVFLPVVADTFTIIDLDGDGFPDQPIPPEGPPVLLELDQNDPYVEFNTVADNGLDFNTVVELDPGDSQIEDPTGYVYGSLGSIEIGFDGVPIPPGGFAVARREVLVDLPIRLVSESGAFNVSQVDLEILATVSGEITYIQPNFEGYVLNTSYIVENEGNFEALGASFRDDGSRSGDPAFLGPTSVYSTDPIAQTSTWTLTDAQIDLILQLPVDPTATSAEATVRIKQFDEVQTENFFGSALFVAEGRIVFEYSAAGFRVELVRSTTDNVLAELIVPEPGTVSSIASGAMALLTLGRTRRTRRRAKGARRAA